MIKPFLFLFFCCLNLAFAFSPFSIKNQTTVPTIVRNGNLTISEYRGTFTLPVVFVKHGSNATYQDGLPSYSPVSFSGIPMRVALYTSQNLLALNSTAVSPYNCTSDHCQFLTKDNQAKNISYANFIANGTKAYLRAYMDFDQWSFDGPVVIVNSTSPTKTNFTDTFGIVGMGIDNDGFGNFHKSPLFSVYLKKNGGNLFFFQSMNFTKSSTPVVTIPTDRNWKSLFKGRIEVGGDEIVINSRLIFDLNTEEIGLPKSQYLSVISSLKKFRVYCGNNKLTRPTCNFNGYISDLPTITIVGNWKKTTVKIPIPPQIYVETSNDQESVSSIKLNLNALSSKDHGASYSTPHFDNTIVLGRSLMRYYYSVFDGRDYSHPKISLYTSIDVVDSPKEFHFSTKLIIGVVSLIVLIGLICCCRNFKKARNNERYSSSGRSILIDEDEEKS